MHRTARRRAAYIIAVIAAVLSLAGPASAQSSESYQGDGGISTPTPNPVVGSRVQILGYGCGAGDTVTIILDGTAVGTVVADPDGEFSTVITAPSQVGPATVQAQCSTGTYVLTLNVISASAGSLAYTGSDSIPLVRLGLVLIAVGLFAVLATRRERRRSPIPAKD